jgi:hypothetical protein
MAVQLHVGDAGALSGQTAARLYGLRMMYATCVWVRTAIRCRGRLPPWVVRTVASCRGRGRHGFARFERWLATTEASRRPSQSDFELTVLDAIGRAGLPEPRRQHPVTLPSGELVHLDFAWPEALLAVEPGHTWWHGGNAKMVADYARDRACGRIGWCVMRYGQEVRGDLASLGREVREMYDVRLAAGR